MLRREDAEASQAAHSELLLPGIVAWRANRAFVAPASRRPDRRRLAATDARRVRTGGRDGRSTRWRSRFLHVLSGLRTQDLLHHEPPKPLRDPPVAVVLV